VVWLQHGLEKDPMPLKAPSKFNRLDDRDMCGSALAKWTLYSSTTTSTPTTTTPMTTSGVSSSPSPSVTFLNNQTGVLGFAFQGFSSYNYTGSHTTIYREQGFFNLGLDCLSYVWLPNGTDCCLTFCLNTTTASGWRCQPRYQTQASGPFPRIYIWCGNDNPSANETCS